MTVTVYALESQPLVVEGLAHAFERCEDLALVGAADSVWEALQEVPHLRPSVLLVDPAAAGQGPLEAVRSVLAAAAFVQPVLLVGDLTKVESLRALQAGVRGICRRTLPVNNVLDCLRAVGQGNIWIERSISNQVVGLLNPDNVLHLTPREQEIVSLVRRGLKNKEIAEQLSITTGTVKVHLMHIFEKTGVRDRFELAMDARRLLGSEIEPGWRAVNGSPPSEKERPH